MKKVAIIMGSDSDWPVVKGACDQQKSFGIPFEAHILSAHRTPAAAAEFARSARANGFGVLICAAGMAAHLAGAFAGNSTLPVIGIPYEAHILSAHRTPAAAAEFAKSARANGFGVLICAAGMAAHLAGAFAGNYTLPVIGIPMKGGAMDGLDALLATVQMPSGIPVATVALNGAKNAAVLAAQMLAIHDARIAALLAEDREKMARSIAEKDAAIRAEAAAL